MSFHYGSKTIQRDGAPCVVAAHVGTLGNDREAREATKPRTAYKSAYYAGGYRMVINGVPTRLAAYVKDWAPWMRRALGRGTMDTYPNGKPRDAELAHQMAILFPKAETAAEP